MIKQEVIEKISKYFKLTQFEAEKIYDDIFSIIMSGVKNENIADVTNLGEFITKYNNGKNGNGNNNEVGNGENFDKKTVEFLASSNLEEELNQSIKESIKTVTESLQNNIVNTNEVNTNNGASIIEDEFRKKREELLNKISIHPLQDSAKEKTNIEKPEEKPLTEPVLPEPEISKMELVEPGLPENIEEDISLEEKVADEPEQEKETEIDEDMSQKSFSDYFAEIKGEPKPEPEKETVEINEKLEPHVIPISAVELHNEITHPVEYTETPVIIPPVQEVPGNQVEHINEDNSYYIWYKDSEANVNETQTMSYEYELLYQATKEAEYKSKLKLYVSTFILFFSIVLVLLIFSPVIYKVFFTPIDQPVQVTDEQNNSTELQNEQSNPQNNIAENNQNQVNPAIIDEKTGPDKTEQKPPSDHQQTPPVTQQKEEVPPPQQKQEQAPPVQQTQPEQKQQTQQQSAGTNINGVTKNTMGWADEKYKVIYVQLENGKFTIQESAWESDSKANKRISTVEGFKISGLKGNVIKVDLGEKGIWFRARFGEFTTIEEARVKAEELRNKEGIRFQALLAYFLFVT